METNGDAADGKAVSWLGVRVFADIEFRKTQIMHLLDRCAYRDHLTGSSLAYG
jgi:hypothetical protein